MKSDLSLTEIEFLESRPFVLTFLKSKRSQSQITKTMEMSQTLLTFFFPVHLLNLEFQRQTSELFELEKKSEIFSSPLDFHIKLESLMQCTTEQKSTAIHQTIDAVCEDLFKL